MDGNPKQQAREGEGEGDGGGGGERDGEVVGERDCKTFSRLCIYNGLQCFLP